MKLKTIDTNTQNININKMINKAVKLAIEEGYKKANNEAKSKINYYLKTEQLLYRYPVLKKQVIAIEQYINDLIRDGYQKKSKDIVKIPQNVNTEKYELEELHNERIKERQLSLERTKMDIKWIESALEQVKYKEEYKLIELRYFEQLEVQEIIKQLNIGESTFRRKRNAIINELSILLFGIDAVTEK